MVYFGKKENKEKFEQLDHEIAELQKRVVYVKELTSLSFTKQVIEEGKVVKYYTSNIPYRNIDEHLSRVITVAINDIPSVGQHLVITQFVQRANTNILIEIYQYNSSADISSALRNAKFYVSYQKEN